MRRIGGEQILELAQLLHVPVFQLENRFKRKIVTVTYPGGNQLVIFSKTVQGSGTYSEEVLNF